MLISLSIYINAIIDILPQLRTYSKSCYCDDGIVLEASPEIDSSESACLTDGTARRRAPGGRAINLTNKTIRIKYYNFGGDDETSLFISINMRVAKCTLNIFFQNIHEQGKSF